MWTDHEFKLLALQVGPFPSVQSKQAKINVPLFPTQNFLVHLEIINQLFDFGHKKTPLYLRKQRR